MALLLVLPSPMELLLAVLLLERASPILKELLLLLRRISNTPRDAVDFRGPAASVCRSL
jgi:hypothetical protein